MTLRALVGRGAERNTMISGVKGHPTRRVATGRVQAGGIIVGASASPYQDHQCYGSCCSEGSANPLDITRHVHRFLLPVTDDTFFIIGPAVTFVATARVYLAVDLVQGQIIPAVYQFAVRPVSQLDWRLDLQFVGMAVVAEGAFMAGRAEICFPSRVQAMAFYELPGMDKRRIRLHGSPDLILMAFDANRTTFSQLLGMPGRKGRFIGEQAAGSYPQDSRCQQKKDTKLVPPHFFAPLFVYS